jgi:hypothetical protein
MKQSSITRFRGPQFKIGSLVKLKGTNGSNGKVGIITKANHCYDGFVEVMVGSWRGSINKFSIEVIG